MCVRVYTGVCALCSAWVELDEQVQTHAYDRPLSKLLAKVIIDSCCFNWIGKSEGKNMTCGGRNSTSQPISSTSQCCVDRGVMEEISFLVHVVIIGLIFCKKYTG